MNNKLIEQEAEVASTQSLCFGCGAGNSYGLQLVFTQTEGAAVACTAQIAGHFDGHPGYVHGGVIATMLDEAMIKALRTTGRTGVTRRMEVEYQRPVPSHSPIRIEGRLLRSEQNRHWLEARVLNQRGRTLALGKGEIVEIKPRS